MGFLNRLFGKPPSLELIAKVGEQVETYTYTKPIVLHEKVSPDIHLDIYWSEPTELLPYHTFVTCGMASKPMNGPDGPLFSELVLFLPKDWPVDRLLEDESAYWPINVLKTLARYPHQHKTCVWSGHSVPLGDVATGTEFTAVMLVPPYLLDPHSSPFEAAGRTVHLHALAFLHEEELQLKLEQGSDALLYQFKDEGAIEIFMAVNPNRHSAV